MNHNKNIEEEVQKTLQYLEKPQKIKSNPFFYTRVMARIDDLESEEKHINTWQLIPAVLNPVLILIIFCLNIVVITFTIQQNNLEREDRSQQLQAFAKNYLLTEENYKIWFK